MFRNRDSGGRFKSTSLANAFGRLKKAIRELAKKMRRDEPLGMIGEPPSARRISADPRAHARQFAHDFADFLERCVEGRMHALGVAEKHIGLADPSRALPGAVFHPKGETGGAVIGERFAIDTGVFNPERYSPMVGET